MSYQRNISSGGSVPSTTARPHFPPDITLDELIANAVGKLRKTGKPSKTPNAFFAYRMAVSKKLNQDNICLNMRELSTIAGNLWIQEPSYVKALYNRLIVDARAYFQKIVDTTIPLQIVHVQPYSRTNSPEDSAVYSDENSNYEPSWNTPEPTVNSSPEKTNIPYIDQVEVEFSKQSPSPQTAASNSLPARRAVNATNGISLPESANAATLGHSTPSEYHSSTNIYHHYFSSTAISQQQQQQQPLGSLQPTAHLEERIGTLERIVAVLLAERQR